MYIQLECNAWYALVVYIYIYIFRTYNKQNIQSAVPGPVYHTNISMAMRHTVGL